MPAVKAAIRSYRASESGARDLISTIWNISDRSLEGTAGVISSIVDLMDDEDKKKDLLQAWNGFKVEVILIPATANVYSSGLFTSNGTSSRNLYPLGQVLSGQVSLAVGS